MDFYGEEEDEAPPEGDAAGDALEREILDELSEMRGIMLGFARRIAALGGETQEPETLAKLNNAAVRTARAHRQVAVLQLEIAGKRPLASQRGAAHIAQPDDGAPGAGHKVRQRSQSERFPKGLPYGHGDLTDYDDYTDAERRGLESARFFDRLKPLFAALDEDFKAAGRDDICREAPATKFKLIFYIPHPATDRAIAAAQPADVCTIFAMGDRLPPVAGTGPPEIWAAYNERRRFAQQLRARM
jgi:hypothetical protein